MPKKLKFKPEITRIKLNPEQAVLSCACYNTGNDYRESGTDQADGSSNSCCNGKSIATHWPCRAGGTGTSRSVRVSGSTSS